MAYNFIEELKWRGMIHDMSPGTEEQLQKDRTTAYIGFDPTSNTLHIGSLVPIILLVHFYKAGHKPIALVGGATGMIGDPSGKSDERNLLDEVTLNKNVEGIRNVMSRFLDFDSKESNAPILVNNYDWMKDFTFIDFARVIGKRITVNYMMAKESVKKRISGEAGTGMSFTEFTYQLIQGYDFCYLFDEYDCKIQMGGSDQWGNITTGTELIRRMHPDQDAKAFALTCPLITKADGSKFGKTESGNVWLDKDRTSVYKFYQFWLNTTDVDAEKYIKIFTFLDKNTIDLLIEEHHKNPGLHLLQKKLAYEVTSFVHSEEETEEAIKTSQVLYSKSFKEDISKLDLETLEDVFSDLVQAEVDRSEITSGLDMIAALAAKTNFLSSNGEARRALKENSISVNKIKVDEQYCISDEDLIGDTYVVINRGKRKTFILKAV
ncbi:MAG: tyrosine--tRNA ligase [Bacteroidia bacterium]|nr:tyrosine--tRNA ligase [Bacteroidia bacterium]NNK72860.1 tyrosine--tRNA ligase [Flavobacteriaceae bacterium]